MAWPPDRHFTAIIQKANRVLRDVRFLRETVHRSHAVLNLEGSWGNYRIVASEIHRNNGTVKYSYYVLDKNNVMVAGFDNSPDRFALRLKYGPTFSAHLHEELPHQHPPDGDIRLTEWMDFEEFLAWVEENL